MTLVKAGPCVVVQRKTPATDGYDAVQLGLIEFVKTQRINKPTAGHLKKAGAEGAKFLREFQLRPRRRRPEAGRPGAGRRVQAEGQSGRDRHQQGPRLRRRREAPPLPRRSGIARLDVPPRAGFDRRIQLSLARVSRHAHGRPHGNATR